MTFLHFLDFVFCVWMLCLHVGLCATCRLGVCEGQNRVQATLEQELQLEVTVLVLGMKPGFSARWPVLLGAEPKLQPKSVSKRC